MNTRSVAHPSKPKKLIVLMSIILLIVIITMGCFSSIWNKDFGAIIESVRKKDWIKAGLPTMSIISTTFSNIGTLLIITILVYNFANTYKSFLLYTVISWGFLIVGTLKLIFRQTVPIIKSSGDIPVNCSLGFGIPSSEMLISTIFYFTLYEIIISTFPDKKALKYILIVVISLILLFVGVVNIFEGYYPLNHVIFSFLLGFSLMLLLFGGWNINLNDGKQFYNLIKKKLWVFLAFYLVPSLILFILIVDTFTETKKPNESSEITTCDYKLFNITFFEQNSEKTYLQAGYFFVAFFLSSFFSVFGIKCELHFLFKDNHVNWVQYNLSGEDSEAFDDTASLLSNITITKDTKWNKTGIVQNVIRLILFILLSGLILSLSIIPGPSNFFYVLFIKIIIPLSLFNFCLFFLFKKIFAKLSLTNGTLMSMLKDNN